jgi:hypothetical protein
MSNSDYNFVSRLIHRFALQSKAIAEISFDLENLTVAKKKISSLERHVFVSGLARSGTTMLMRYLHETGEFKSLTYLDMPFVLMPNTWKKIVRPKISAKFKERAHRDGILVSLNSPEAFEEVFWRIFTGDQYVREDRLNLYNVESGILKKFQNYINNILLSGNLDKQTRYLSKNNNNVLRLKCITNRLPNAIIITPFRDPLQHALSLLNQHIHFSKIQSEDKFSLDYMNWLGHFEFGLNQKPFYLNDDETFNRMKHYDKTDINFWLLSWLNYYQYVVQAAPEKTIFLNYEKFCQTPTAVLSKLFEIINVEHTFTTLLPFTPTDKPIGDFDAALLKQCKIVYNQLNDKFSYWFTIN